MIPEVSLWTPVFRQRAALSGTTLLGSLALHPDFSVTRAGSATYRDSSGIWQTASTDEARFHHDKDGVLLGILPEESRTNLYERSQELDNAYWSKTRATVTANATAGPFGTTIADKLVESTDAGTHFYSKSLTKAASALAYARTVFVKPDERDRVVLRITGAGETNGAFMDVTLTGEGTINSSGAAGPSPFTSVSAEVFQEANGWYRLALRATSNTETTIASTLKMHNGTGESYTGDGSSGVYVEDNQLEQADFESTPIITTSAAATRNADDIRDTSISYFNATEGTILVVFRTAVGFGGNQFYVAFNDNTVADEIFIGRNLATNLQALVNDNSSTQANLQTTVANSTEYKVAFAYKANDFAKCVDGGTVQTDVSGTLPTVDRGFIGSDHNGRYANSPISLVRYFPTRLTDAQLQSITS
ncbi:MAG: hypothetical protein MJA83_15810 [Gammaproteobacteria bacterium]|nr:hypothetical protein [Gammaproteobacteria bacterium]